MKYRHYQYLGVYLCFCCPFQLITLPPPAEPIISKQFPLIILSPRANFLIAHKAINEKQDSRAIVLHNNGTSNKKSLGRGPWEETVRVGSVGEVAPIFPLLLNIPPNERGRAHDFRRQTMCASMPKDCQKLITAPAQEAVYSPTSYSGLSARPRALLPVSSLSSAELSVKTRSTTKGELFTLLCRK